MRFSSCINLYFLAQTCTNLFFRLKIFAHPNARTPMYVQNLAEPTKLSVQVNGMDAVCAVWLHSSKI